LLDGLASALLLKLPPWIASEDAADHWQRGHRGLIASRLIEQLSDRSNVAPRLTHRMYGPRSACAPDCGRTDGARKDERVYTPLRVFRLSHQSKPEHLARKAIVYLRQSSDRQVRQNKESQLLQYAVAERMRALGWAQVEAINSDLRSSAGIAATQREGFERVLSR
jgi:hypothetical protein